MPFKISLINKELLLYTFRGSGWIAILNLLALLFALPLEVLMAVIEKRVKEYEHIQSLFFIHSTIQYALMFVIPVLLAVLLFRFLQVKQHSDLIHSLPLSKKRIYIQHLLEGILFLLLPIFFTSLVLLVLHWTMDVSIIYTLQDIGSWMGITFIIEFFIFSLAVLIGMITGLSTMQAALTYIVLILPVALIVLFTENMKLLLFGFAGQYYLTLQSWRFSPLTLISDNNNLKLFSVEMIVYFILAICICYLSFLLYKNRKNENVSYAFVFQKLKPVFKYGMTVGFMLVSGIYFSETSVTLGWVIFGYVFGAILGFILAEMVLQKTWRIKLQLKGFGVYVLVILAVAFIIKLDIVGFEARVPDTFDIKKVSISHTVNSYYDDGNIEPMIYLTEPKNIKDLRHLHEQIIEHGQDDTFQSNREIPPITIKYELENGQVVIREYQLRNYDAFIPYLKKIYESQEFKRKFYTLLNISSADIYRIQVTGSNDIEKSVQLSEPKDIRSALEALKTDLSNQSYEEMTGEKGQYGQLTFILGDNRQITLNWNESLYHFNQWFEKTGKSDQVWTKAEDLSYMLVEEYNPDTDYSSPNFVSNKNSLKVKNAKQKKELLNKVTPGVDGQYVVLLYYKGKKQVEVRGLSDLDLPNIVQEHFNH